MVLQTRRSISTILKCFQYLCALLAASEIHAYTVLYLKVLLNAGIFVNNAEVTRNLTTDVADLLKLRYKRDVTSGHR